MVSAKLQKFVDITNEEIMGMRMPGSAAILRLSILGDKQVSKNPASFETEISRHPRDKGQIRVMLFPRSNY
jgi:hypothetical protein